MNKYNECNNGKVSYLFSKTQKIFANAQNACLRNGNDLVENIDHEIYTFLNNCPDAQDGTSFWIGLKKADNCLGDLKYIWISETECIDDLPFSIQNIQQDNQDSGVTIRIDKSNTAFHAAEFPFNSKNYFICQQVNEDIIEQPYFSKSTQQKYVTSRANATLISTSGYKSPRTDVPQENNYSSNAGGAVAPGVILGSLLLLLLMIFFYYRHKIKAKKSNINFAFFKANMFRSQKTVATISTDKEIKVNSIYNK